MKLLDEIREKIKSVGPISFRDFMDLCLYHPELGYYRVEHETDSRDYRTSPEISPLFAKYIGKQLCEMWELAGVDQLMIAELGGGDLTLSAGILDHLRRSCGNASGRLTYWVLEHKERAGADLPEGLTAVVSRFGDIPFESSPFTIVLSNEFFDALPVHVVVQTEKGLREVFVTSRLEEVLLPVSSPDLEEYFEFIGINLPVGFRTEVNLEAANVIRNLGSCMARGFVTTIDYGFPSHELYSPARSDGTLVSYYRHRLVESILERPGAQDITSHVNFSALAKWGSEVGLETTGFTDQGNFLISLGILDETESAPASETETFADSFERSQPAKELVSPTALGEVFKVLIQHKGFETPPKLTGLSRPPYRRWRL